LTFGRTKTYLDKAGIVYDVAEQGGKKMFRIALATQLDNTPLKAHYSERGNIGQ